MSVRAPRPAAGEPVKCPECGRMVALRQDGTFRTHGMGPEFWWRYCEAAGRRPDYYNNLGETK